MSRAPRFPGLLFPGSLCAMLFASAAAAPAADPLTYSPTAEAIRDTWILDGKVEMTVRNERELALALPSDAQFTLWTPQVFEGPLEVSFVLRNLVIKGRVTSERELPK